MPSSLEAKFLVLWDKRYPQFPLAQELMLIPKRKFRFDFAYIPAKVAVEINGGTYIPDSRGHNSGKGLNRDYKKINLAQLNGWVVFQLDSKMITSEWLDNIGAAIQGRI